MPDQPKLRREKWALKGVQGDGMGHWATPCARFGPVIRASPVLGNAKNWWDDRLWVENGHPAFSVSPGDFVKNDIKQGVSYSE